MAEYEWSFLRGKHWFCYSWLILDKMRVIFVGSACIRQLAITVVLLRCTDAVTTGVNTYDGRNV